MKRKKKHHPNHTGERKCEYEYKCIDGNFTYYPVAVCRYYKGVLTNGLLNVHRCRERKCKRLVEGVTFE